jgi:hypothetical protein
MEMPSSISTRLQYQHKSLLDIIEGLSDDQIRMTVVPGKWSIFETLVHLGSYQHVTINRIKEILELDNPAFNRYSAELDPMFGHNCTKSSREIMQDLLTTRKDMSASLLNFTEADLIKTGSHPIYGQMHLIQWLNFFLLHEAHHLFEIFKMTAELKKANRLA